MEKQYHPNENEKMLLTYLGKNPEASTKELQNHTTYRRKNSVVRKINQLKKQRIVIGPAHLVDYGKLCRNSVCRLICILELNETYQTVVSYLKLIQPLISLYPVLSAHKEVLFVTFLTSDRREIGSLLQLLKENRIINDYIMRQPDGMTIMENPDFSGDLVPSLDNLLAPCQFPDMSFGMYDTEWGACDIAVVSQLHGGHEPMKLMDILKRERTLLNRTWTYDQIKYSYRKMLERRLIRKIHFVCPLPLGQCSDFYLFLKTKDRVSTERILFNFARGARLYREYSRCQDWGMIGCVAHPQFLLNLMYTLDQIEEITEKELYHLRYPSHGVKYVGEHSEMKFYNIEEQTLEYPYHEFREHIKIKLDLNSVL